jgi:hypothetical protein
MSNRVPGHAVPGLSISRRTLLGSAVAAALLVPLIGAGAARADDGTDGQPAEEEYEIPEGIGSEPWW